MHYYFSDKAELIIASVRRYKATCVTRYDDVVATSTTPAELVTGFADKLCETIVDDASMHRLWYDLRTQSMFDESLRHDVLEIDATLENMIERVLTRFAELGSAALSMPIGTAYAMLDGIFERALLRHIAGVHGVLEELRATTGEPLPPPFHTYPRLTQFTLCARGLGSQERGHTASRRLFIHRCVTRPA